MNMPPVASNQDKCKNITSTWSSPIPRTFVLDRWDNPWGEQQKQTNSIWPSSIPTLSFAINETPLGGKQQKQMQRSQLNTNVPIHTYESLLEFWSKTNRNQCPLLVFLYVDTSRTKLAAFGRKAQGNRASNDARSEHWPSQLRRTETHEIPAKCHCRSSSKV